MLCQITEYEETGRRDDNGREECGEWQDNSVLTSLAGQLSQPYQPWTITVSLSPTCLCHPMRAKCWSASANESAVSVSVAAGSP